jgi:hypothetical protein
MYALPVGFIGFVGFNAYPRAFLPAVLIMANQRLKKLITRAQTYGEYLVQSVVPHVELSLGSVDWYIAVASIQ